MKPILVNNDTWMTKIFSLQTFRKIPQLKEKTYIFIRLFLLVFKSRSSPAVNQRRRIFF